MRIFWSTFKTFIQKNYLPLLLLIIAVLIYFHHYYRSGLPVTHDSENHVARFAQYALALKQGQFPPRFAPELLNSFGYPVFNYNYPLANLLSLPFSAAGFHFETTFKIIVIAFVLIGTMSTYLWTKTLATNLLKTEKNSVWPPFLCALIFLFNPYLFNTIWIRGSIGEALAISLLPLLFYFIEFYQQKNSSYYLGFTFTLILFFLSHNVTVLFGTALVLIYAVIRLFSGKFTLKNLWFQYKKLFLSFALAFFAVAWFWLPALLEKNLVVLDNADLSNSYSEHFLDFTQLLTAHHVFGFSRLGSIDDLSFGLGPTFWITIILTLCLLINHFVNKKTKCNYICLFLITFCLILTSLIIFLQLPISDFLWSNLPFIKFIQFPWRLSLVTIFPILAILVVILMKNSRSYPPIIVSLVFSLFFIIPFTPVSFYSRSREDYLVYMQSTSTANENIAQQFTYPYFEQVAKREPTIIGMGESQVSKWFGSAHEFSLSLSQDSLIIEDTMNFPGWQTKIENETQSSPNSTKVTYIDDATIGGRIAYKLPAGNYTVKTSFTALTPARLIGQLLTLLSIIILLYFSWLALRQYTKPV